MNFSPLACREKFILIYKLLPRSPIEICVAKILQIICCNKWIIIFENLTILEQKYKNQFTTNESVEQYDSIFACANQKFPVSKFVLFFAGVAAVLFAHSLPDLRVRDGTAVPCLQGGRTYQNACVRGVGRLRGGAYGPLDHYDGRLAEPHSQCKFAFALYNLTARTTM